MDLSLLVALISGIAIGVIATKFLSTPKPQNEKKKKDQPNTLQTHFKEEIKMVIVVCMNLGMEKGKIAAQCSHAAVKGSDFARKNSPDLYQQWKNNGQAKIVLKCADDQELLALAGKANLNGVHVSIIRDAGRTQIASGSTTCAAFGPAPKSIVDKVTGHLKLF